MDIKGNYKLKKAIVGFDDEFNMKFMSAKEILALDKNQDDDMVIIGMLFARMTAEITDNELIFRLNPNIKLSSFLFLYINESLTKIFPLSIFC